MSDNAYVLSKSEVVVCILKSILMATVCAWLLYRCIYGMITVFIFLPGCLYQQKKKSYEKRKEELLVQFKDVMQSVAAALQAGYSIENAWQASEQELKTLYGEETFFLRQLHHINLAVSVNEPIEQLLHEFAIKSDCEDILDFAEVFLFAKRSGGDFYKIMQTTITHISDRIEVEKEIQMVIAGKKMEQKIMNVVPVGILCYLNFTAKEFLSPLYGNIAGVVIMTMALVVYLLAIALSERIIQIKV